ncbi:hypothetical protein PspLS_09446 [Pyricularia sp. CBS 133598]|nr:hypothetical protein PspLS_09446 [Pyricularia sp. CBS 133598]
MASDRQRLNDQPPAGEEDESMIDSDAPTRGLTPGDNRDGDGDGSGANGSKTGDVDSPDMSRFRARACARCSRSKLRCIRRAEPGAEPCLRCARLGTACTLPEARPRGPKKGQARRVGQLEQKLDGIMSLLTASQQLLNQNNTVPQSGSTQANSVASPISEGGLADEPSAAKSSTSTSRPTPQQQPHAFLHRPDLVPATPDSIGHRSAHSPATSSNGTASQHDASRTLPRVAENISEQIIELWPGLDMTWRDAAQVLNVYVTLYVPNFPFIPLPPRLSPEELYAATPFLFRTIMLVAAPQSASTQRAGEKWFRRSIAEYVVVLGEKRLELLQALLLFIAWGDYRFYMESKATPLLQMAVGIVVDLGLNKAPLSVNNLAPFSLLNEALRRHPHLRGKASHSNDDMRALLGCFYVTSQVTTLFRREHHLPYTDFVDKCVTELAGANEYVTDRTLVAMVKMQCLVRRAHAIMAGSSPEPGANAPYTAAAAMALTAIRRELYEPISSYGTMDERSKHLLKMHCHASLIAMHEPVIYARSVAPIMATQEVASTASNPPGGKRTDAMWHCLRALLDFIKLYIAMPLDQAGTMAIFPAANLAFTFVTTTRLLFMDDPDWDAAEARRQFDFPGLAQRIMEKYAASDAYETGGANDVSGPGSVPYKRRFHEDGNSLMATYMQKTRWLMQWYLAKTTPGNNGAPVGGGTDNNAYPTTKPGYDSCLPPQQRQQQQQKPQQHRQNMAIQQAQHPAQFPMSQQQQPVYAGDPMVGFDATSFLEDFDDSFWHAFLSVDSQLAYPPMVAGSVPRPI